MNVPMTDYYPLIDTAVAALENNTSAARRTVYEYARSALVRQSRNKIPPLTEAELACERLALEQAILRVEAERGRRSSRDASRTHPRMCGPRNQLPSGPRLDRPVPPIPAPGPRSQQNQSSPRREAPARREPPPVARREQAVPPRPTTSGVGAREVANQPPSPAPPPRLRFRLFDRRNQEVANHPGTCWIWAPQRGASQAWGSQQAAGCYLAGFGPAKAHGRTSDESRPGARPRSATAPLRPAATSSGAAERASSTTSCFDGAFGRRRRSKGGRALADREKCVDRRSHAGRGYAAHPAGPTRVRAPERGRGLRGPSNLLPRRLSQPLSRRPQP